MVYLRVPCYALYNSIHQLQGKWRAEIAEDWDFGLGVYRWKGLRVTQMLSGLQNLLWAVG